VGGVLRGSSVDCFSSRRIVESKYGISEVFSVEEKIGSATSIAMEDEEIIFPSALTSHEVNVA
jgi:hypothetical protein